MNLKRKFPSSRKGFRRGTKKARLGRKKASVKLVRRMISRTQENKCSFKHSGALAITTAAGTVINLVEMQKGNNAGQRNGQRITVNKIDVRVACDANTAGANSCRFRAMIIVDKQADAALPSTVDWFLDKTVANAVLSGYDPNTVGPRYQILRDRTLQLNMGGGATDATIRKEFRYLSFKRHNISFNQGNVGDITDIVKGALYLCVYTDAAVNGPSYAWTTTYTFKDA